MTNYFFQKKILVAPLDWGLGHATRCIPVITHLKKIGCEIIFAGSAIQLALIKREFPGIVTEQINGYNIRYTRSKRWFPFKILLQAPKILLNINREKQVLHGLIGKYGPDLVISDNRYGFSSPVVACVFITHQLNIIAPFKWLEKLIRSINYYYINRFNQCWVPDYPGNANIAGRLSHPGQLPLVPVKYLGPLSRFTYRAKVTYSYKFLFLISGPEPQRSLLEEKVLSLVTNLDGHVLIIRGKPGEFDDSDKLSVPQNCTVINHLETMELEEKIAASEYVISRSGYTTIMEILSLRKKSLLIPTPGQTEQEYLSRHLTSQQFCYVCAQDKDMTVALRQLQQYNFKLPNYEPYFFEDVIESSLRELLQKKS